LLRELKVRDLALVAESTVHFGPGLNLLTGETGSGKSLIIDALTLAVGGRASVDQVRHGAERAIVEASFDSTALWREVGKRGGARIDGRAANPTQLRELGARLVAVHGQHEHHALLDVETQTLLLDAYAGALAQREAVGAAHAAWSACVAQVRDLEQLRARGRREREFMLWQLDELRRAELVEGEDDALAAERSAVRHAARLADLGLQALDALHDDSVARAAAAMTQAAGIDPRLADHAARLQALTGEAADVADEVRRYVDGIDSDPGRLERIESRLAQLDAIKRKHGGTIAAAIEERDRLDRQLATGEDLDAAVATAEAEQAASREALESASAELTRARTQAARRLAKAVAEELRGLRLDGARFDVALRRLSDLGPAGAEAADYLERVRAYARLFQGQAPS
jgi:DNA repair protein RecN (Recombination protein N)